MGRFINADAYASTGQGVLGNNMFAYCGNNPTIFSDEYGTNPGYAAVFFAPEIACGLFVIAVASVILNPHFVEKVAETVSVVYSRIQTEVYELAESLKDPNAEKYANHQPRVHHIVPIGNFSSRSNEVQGWIRDMQQILIEVGIDVANDTVNQVCISHGFHSPIHTNAYFEMLHSELSPVRGSRAGVMKVLRDYKAMLMWDDLYREQMYGE